MLLNARLCLLLPLLAVACGGAVASTSEPTPSPSPSGNPGTPSGNPGNPGFPGADASAPPQNACPSVAPANGAACSTPGMTCEFGGSGPANLCSIRAACVTGANGGTTWNVPDPEPGCMAVPAQNSAACPSTFGPPGACPAGTMNGTRCAYPEGICGCESCFTQATSTQSTQWACSGFIKSTTCPASRPNIGSSCAAEGQHCEYGAPCDLLIPWYPMTCNGGAWSEDPHGEDCSQPVCAP
jgi:hypothetical protein